MAHFLTDINLKNRNNPFLLEKHINYLTLFYKLPQTDVVLFDYMLLNAICWTTTSLFLLKRSELIMREEVLKFVNSCRNQDGGYGPSPKFDSHIHSTLCAIQIYILFDTFEEVDIAKTSSFISSLQRPDGSFVGDCSEEKDTRFIFCGIAALYLLNKLDLVNRDKVIEYILSCLNFDCSFGAISGAESHSAQVYCCVGSLYLLGREDLIIKDELGFWLCERQCESGGFNGRPEKLPDVCYSWWVLSSLCMIKRDHWIDKSKLKSFILACQDLEDGGFSDRPENMADPFHTLFSVCGLSLSKEFNDQILPVNPILCLPQFVVDRHMTSISKLHL